jgi:hypothetical protein
VDPGGNVFYLHENTGMILTAHPLDHHYQNLYMQMKATADKEAVQHTTAQQTATGAAERTAGRPDGAAPPAAAPPPRAQAPPVLPPFDLGALPASVLLSESTKLAPSIKERWGALTTRRASRTHQIELLAFELTVRVQRGERGRWARTHTHTHTQTHTCSEAREVGGHAHAHTHTHTHTRTHAARRER